MFKFKDKTDQYLDSIHELNVQIRDLKHKVNVLEIELKHPSIEILDLDY